MPTLSAFARNAFRTGIYEAQDILVKCDDVDVIHLEPASRFRLKENLLMRMVSHDVSKKLVFLNPGLRPVRLKRDYDVFILVCPWWSDVWFANAVQGWRDHCKTSILWIDELWAHSLPRLKNWLPLLSKFDHVIVGIPGSGKAIGDAIGRQCHEVQGGVDTIRFSPYPSPPPRVIDVYSVGRRLDETHRALLKKAARKEMFYVHDTLFNTGDSQTRDLWEHREMYANMAKRTRFFMVAPGKMDVPAETHGQVALGFRYFEGSAAGAVLVGQAPDSEAFTRHFNWPQAVIDVQPDGSDIVEVIASLSADPERLQEMSCRNAEEAIRRHDWVYRWKEILGIAGLKPAPAMEARERQLRELADLVREGRR